ncbi:MAG: glycosyltransferase family 4 protein [Candidatus Nomurabacteria bacterium]|nr:MAG: glycosyltransferase family 4 protein [Candidatus Nomurabacteria bacterium]
MPQSILIIHNTLPSYRRELFALLGSWFQIDLYISETASESLKGVPGVQISPLSGQGRKGALQQLKEKKYAAVVTGNWDTPQQLWGFYSVAKYCRKQNVPYLVWSEEWAWPMTWRRKLVQPIISTLVQNASAVIVPGVRSEQHFLQMGVRAKKIFWAPNASRVEVREASFKESTLPQILSVARFLPRKGLDVLCKSFASMHVPAELILFGADDSQAPGYRQKLEQLCYALDIASRVHFIRDDGDVSAKVQAYANCDIFILASTAQPIAEPWGLVVNEVMEFAKPVVVTDAVGSANDLVQDDVNGFIVRAGDTNTLTRALDTLASQSSLREQFGRASKERIVNFSYERMAEGFAQALRSVVKG